MSFSLVVAVSENWAIGKDNKLLWHLSDDLKNFKRITSGKTVVMGRNTFESIGRPLPNRKNIVLTSKTDFAVDGVEVFHNTEQVLKLAGEVCIIGGARVYSEFLEHCETLYITHVHTTIEDADTYMQAPCFTEYSVSEQSFHAADTKNDHSFRCVVYKKVLKEKQK